MATQRVPYVFVPQPVTADSADTVNVIQSADDEVTALVPQIGAASVNPPLVKASYPIGG